MKTAIKKKKDGHGVKAWLLKFFEVVVIELSNLLKVLIKPGYC